jgi:hypothetical protein
MYFEDDYDTDDTDEIMSRKTGGVEDIAVISAVHGTRDSAQAAGPAEPSCIIQDDWVFSICATSRAVDAMEGTGTLL